jgi:hypothetical protein
MLVSPTLPSLATVKREWGQREERVLPLRRSLLPPPTATVPSCVCVRGHGMGAFAWPLAALGTSCGCVSILLAAPIATSGLQTVRPRSCFVRGGERHGPAGRRTHVQARNATCCCYMTC